MSNINKRCQAARPRRLKTNNTGGQNHKKSEIVLTQGRKIRRIRFRLFRVYIGFLTWKIFNVWNNLNPFFYSTLRSAKWIDLINWNKLTVCDARNINFSQISQETFSFDVFFLFSMQVKFYYPFANKVNPKNKRSIQALFMQYMRSNVTTDK